MDKHKTMYKRNEPGHRVAVVRVKMSSSVIKLYCSPSSDIKLYWTSLR